MERSIIITSGAVQISGVLSASPTADAVWNCLPLHASVSTWGDEIYFSIPVKVGRADDAKEQLHQPLENRTAAAFFSPASIVICDNDMAGKDGFEATIDQEKAKDRKKQTGAAHFQDLAQVSLPDRDLVGGDEVECNPRNAGDDD